MTTHAPSTRTVIIQRGSISMQNFHLGALHNPTNPPLFVSGGGQPNFCNIVYEHLCTDLALRSEALAQEPRIA